MNQIKQGILFNKIWEIWPKKEKEASARKGLSLVCSEKEIDGDRLLTAANIYASEIRDVKFCHSLGNWFRDDHYLDIYSEIKDIFSYEEKIKKQELSAREVLESWNKASEEKDHWLKIVAEKERLETIKESLYNDTFKNNWTEALKICEKIFGEKFQVGDWRKKIKPSISWFCKCQYDNHTVAKLIEGEFGKATEKIKPKKEVVIQSPEKPEDADEILKKLLDEFDDVTGEAEEEKDIASKLGFE